MYYNDRIDLTLDKKDKSKVKHLMKMLDRTFKVGRKLDKNYTYRQTIEDSLSFFLSKEFNLKSRKELN